MADAHYTITAAVTHETLLSLSERLDQNRLKQHSAAFLSTYSSRDWLMSDISAHRSHLSLQSLNWLATEDEAKKNLEEYLDTEGLWWFTSILYRDDLLPGIADLDAILALADREPNRFGADQQIVQQAREWNSGCAATDYDIPNADEGTDPLYVVATIFALRRLLDFAHTNGLCVLHLRYSYRRRP